MPFGQLIRSGRIPKKSDIFFLALKGRNIPTQGNALGKKNKDCFSPERALHVFLI
jgi:hypothetical protein